MSARTEPSTTIVVEYRLTEADVCRYRAASLPWRCWRTCSRCKAALGLMVILGGFLVGVCVHSQGNHAVGIAVATALAVVVALTLGREARFERRVCRLARAMGLPRDLRLVVAPEGISEQSGHEIDDPERIFAWSEVVDVTRVDHLTVIHLRPAGGVLIVPDSAFDKGGGRAEFEEALTTWRCFENPESGQSA